MQKQIRKLLALPLKISMLGFERGAHIWRFSMYKHLKHLFSAIEIPPDSKVLSISGSERLCKVLGFTDEQITSADYPEHNLMALNFEDSTFDFVVSDQVLEHLNGDPQLAFDESQRVLKPGGYALHTTCFVQEVHYGPDDLWRFSPTALKFLASNFSSIVESAGWGNRLMWIYIWLGLRMEGIPLAKWHPIHKIATMNNPRWPAVTWVLAKK